MRRLLAEIRRRGLFGTTAFYFPAAWVVLQVGTSIIDIMDLPSWSKRGLLLALMAGFPIALVLAWFFDIGRKGITRTDVHAEATGVTEVPRVEPPAGHSIAVLPFVNMSAHAEHEYFSDGITEELLNSLAGLPDLKVAARTSSFAFKGKNADIRTIASQLGVRNVLEGSVRWASSRVRITAQLIEAEHGYHLWSQTYDRQLEDIFAIQSEIAVAIADALKLHLGGAAAKALEPSVPTVSMDAYHCYLRGRHMWQRRGEAAIRGAIEQNSQAIALDPRFDRAYATLAAAHAVLPEYTGAPRAQGFAIAKPLALKALALDDTLAEPHGVLSYMQFWSWEWEEAEQSLRRALALDAQDPQLHQWYSNLLNDLARHDDAISEARKAYELDPVSPIVNSVLALCHGIRGEDEAALKHVAIARGLGASGIALAYAELFANLRQHDYDTARASWERDLTALGKGITWVGPVLAAIADRTQLDDALRALAKARATGEAPANTLLLFYVLLEACDETYALADSKLADHSLTHSWLLLPEARAVRADPRFIDLMRQIGVADYWGRHGWPSHLPGPEIGLGAAVPRSLTDGTRPG
jgi:TolB-like protein/Flp pilus assembly protein TadD